MKFINLTPHDINIVHGGQISTIQASGIIAHVENVRESIGEIDGIPICRHHYGPVANIPEPQDGVGYIVSRITAQAVAGTRDDLYVPDCMVRSDSGAIIGCTSLSMV